MGEAVAISQRLPFFHWPIEFPEVFEKGGFDVVLGNPPWEKTTILEREFFSSVPEIVNESRSNIRKKLIDKMQLSNPSMYQNG